MDLIKPKENDLLEPDYWYREGHGLWLGDNWPKKQVSKGDIEKAIEEVGNENSNQKI